MAEFDISQSDKSIKAELRAGKRICQCTGCQLFFTGVQPFDRHLVHDEDYSRPPLCMDAEQMRAIGMVENEHGVWMYGQSKKELAKKARQESAA